MNLPARRHVRISILDAIDGAMTEITLYHNPRCSKSRAALALLREHGADVRLVEYLKTPPDEATLKRLAGQLGLPVREMLRSGERIYRELGLDNPAQGGDDLLRAVAEHPILLQRPIAVAGERAVIGRPPENVLELI